MSATDAGPEALGPLSWLVGVALIVSLAAGLF